MRRLIGVLAVALGDCGRAVLRERARSKNDEPQGTVSAVSPESIT